MATRTRDTPGKDKKLTSPSKQASSGGATASRRKSIANPMPSASTSMPKRTSNNVKPTTSPVPGDTQKQLGKKPVSGSSDNANKQAVARRRSLDKPSTPSNTQKPRGSLSPTVRAASMPGRVTQTRGSLSPTPQSSTGRPTPATRKAVPDKSLKAPKEAAGKQHMLQNRSANMGKSKMGGKKPEAGSGGGGPRINPPEKVHDQNMFETKSQDQESELSSIDEAEQQIVDIGKSNEKGHGDPVMEDQEKVAGESTLEDQQTEETQKGDEEDKIGPAESSTISEPKDAVFESVDSDAVTEPKITNEANMVSEPKEAETMTPESCKISHNEGSNISTNETEAKPHVEDLKEQSINELANITSGESAASNASQETNVMETVEETATRDEAHKPEETKAKEVVVEKNNVSETPAGVEAPEPKESKAKEVVVKKNNVSKTVAGGEAPEPEETKGKEQVMEKKEKPEESKAKDVVENNNVKETVEETATGGNASQPKEAKEKDVVAEKKGTEKPVARTQVAAKLEKKDSAVSNDVIEETASKLREQRKSRVRALAGAFESVISLQDSKS